MGGCHRPNIDVGTCKRNIGWSRISRLLMDRFHTSMSACNIRNMFHCIGIHSSNNLTKNTWTFEHLDLWLVQLYVIVLSLQSSIYEKLLLQSCFDKWMRRKTPMPESFWRGTTGNWMSICGWQQTWFPDALAKIRRCWKAQRTGSQKCQTLISTWPDFRVHHGAGWVSLTWHDMLHAFPVTCSSMRRCHTLPYFRLHVVMWINSLASSAHQGHDSLSWPCEWKGLLGHDRLSWLAMLGHVAMWKIANSIFRFAFQAWEAGRIRGWEFQALFHGHLDNQAEKTSSVWSWVCQGPIHVSAWLVLMRACAKTHRHSHL